MHPVPKFFLLSFQVNLKTSGFQHPVDAIDIIDDAIPFYSLDARSFLLPSVELLMLGKNDGYSRPQAFFSVGFLDCIEVDPTMCLTSCQKIRCI